MPLMLRIKRAVCFVLAVCLLPYGNAFALPSRTASSEAPPSLKPDLSAFDFPATLGRVSETFNGSAGSPVVFLIQDAHAVPEAQTRIREILDYLQSAYGTPVAGLEGVVTRLDPRILRSFPQREILEEVLAEIQERGEWAGPSAAAVLNRFEMDYEGLEERVLYEEGLAFFLQAQSVRQQSETEIRKKREALEKKKRGIYPPLLLSVDSALRDFQNGGRALIEVLRILKSVQAPPPGSQIELVLQQDAREKQDSPGANESELRRFARSLEQFYESQPQDQAVREKARALNEQLQLFQTSQVSAPDFALFLFEASRGLPAADDFPPSFHGGLWASRRLRQLEGTDFFRDFTAYADSVKKQLIRSPEEQALDEASQRLDLMEKWARLELTFEEWRGIEDRRMELERDFLPGALSAPEAFYRNAEARDDAMMSRLAEILQSRVSSASVVAGGFHTAGLTEQLRARGISFAVLTPEITSVPETSPYERQMSGDVSWRSYFRYEKGEVLLYDAFIRSMRDRLLAVVKERSGPETAGYVLKRWRDQILLDLADRGEIEQASEYTRFLDEAARRFRGAMPPGAERVEQFIEQLKTLEKNGTLNEQTIAGLLMPATRPAEAVQAALEPGARWGGRFLKIESGAEGVTLMPDAQAVSARLEELLSGGTAARSELRAASPEEVIKTLAELPYLQNLLFKAQSQPLSLTAAEKETLAWGYRAGQKTNSVTYLGLQGMLVTSDITEMPWDEMAVARAYPALSDEFKDYVLANLLQQARGMNDAAILALAVIISNSVDLPIPEETLHELRHLIHARLASGKKELYLALSLLQDLSPMSDNELKKDFDQIAKGVLLYGFGVRAKMYLPGAEDAELQEWLEDVKSGDGANASFNLRGMGALTEIVDTPVRDKIFDALFAAALSTESGIRESEGLEGLAAAYPNLSGSQKGKVAVLLKKKIESGGESAVFAHRAVQEIQSFILSPETDAPAAGKMTFEMKIEWIPDPLESQAQDLSGANVPKGPDSSPHAAKNSKLAPVYLQAMSSSYSLKIQTLAAQGDVRAIEALGYLYRMSGTQQQDAILKFLRSALKEQGPAADAAVLGLGHLFDLLETSLQEKVFTEIRQAAENLKHGGVRGLVKIALYYNDKGDKNNFESIFKLVKGLSASEYPGSLAAYGKLAHTLGIPAEITKAYELLNASNSNEALLGLAALHSAVSLESQKNALGDKIYAAVLLKKPFALLAMAEIAESAAFFSSDQNTFRRARTAILAALQTANPERHLAAAKILWLLDEDDKAFEVVLSAIYAAAEQGTSEGLLSAAMIHEDIFSVLKTGGISAGDGSLLFPLVSQTDAIAISAPPPDASQISAVFNDAVSQEPALPAEIMDAWNQATAMSLDALDAEKQRAFLEKLKALGVPPASKGFMKLSKILKVFKSSKPEFNPYLISMSLAYKSARNGPFKELVKDFPAVILNSAEAGVPEALIALGHLAQALPKESPDYVQSLTLLFEEAQLDLGKIVSPEKKERVRSALWGLAQVHYRFNSQEVQKYRGILNLTVDFSNELPWLDAVATLTTPGVIASSSEGQAAHLLLKELVSSGEIIANPAIYKALMNAMLTGNAQVNAAIRQSLLKRAFSGSQDEVLPLAAAIYGFLSATEKLFLIGRITSLISKPADAGKSLPAFTALAIIAAASHAQSQDDTYQFQPAKKLSANDGLLMALGIKSVTAKADELLAELQTEQLQDVVVGKLLEMASHSGKATTSAAIRALGELAPRLTVQYRNALYVMLKPKLTSLEIGPERDAAVLALDALYPYLEVKHQWVLQAGFAAVLLTMMEDEEVFNPISAAMALRLKDSDIDAHKKLYSDYDIAIHANPPGEAERLEALVLLDAQIDENKAEVIWNIASQSGAFGVKALLIERGLIKNKELLLDLLKDILNTLDQPVPPASAVRALGSLLRFGAHALTPEQFDLGAKNLLISSLEHPEALVILAKLHQQLDSDTREKFVKQLALDLGGGKSAPEALHAAAALSPEKKQPIVFMTLPPLDSGLSLETPQKEVRPLITAELLRLIAEMSAIPSLDPETLKALRYAKSFAFKVLPKAAAEAWLKELEEAAKNGFSQGGHSVSTTPAWLGMAASALDADKQDLKESIIQSLIQQWGENAAYEGLGYILSRMPAVEDMSLPIYETLRKSILNVLDEQFVISSSGAAEGLSVAFSALSMAERDALIDRLFEYGDIYKKFAVLARIYPYLDAEVQAGVRETFFDYAVSVPAHFEGVGMALPMMAGDDPEGTDKALKKLMAAAALGSQTAALGMAHAFDLLDAEGQKVFFKFVKTRTTAEQLRIFAIVSRQTELMTPSDYAFSDLGKSDDKEIAPAASAVPWPADFNPLETFQGVPWVDAGQMSQAGAFQSYEFDPGRQGFLETLYTIDSPAASGAGNESARKLLSDFESFEDINAEVLMLLMKSDKTIEEMRHLFSVMEKMVKAYLVLFKKQKPDLSIDAAAKSSQDLTGGRAIAKLFLSLREETEKAIAFLQPDAKDSDTLHPDISRMLQLLNAANSGAMIMSPAEQTERDRPDRIRGVTYGEFRQYADTLNSGGTQESALAMIRGTTFHELINIVHQKGVRNLSSLFPAGTASAKGKVQIHESPIGTGQDRSQPFDFQYLDARANPDGHHPLPVRMTALALTKHQLIHGNHKLFSMKDALILSTGNKALINLPLGMHSARIQLSLSPVQETGRIFVNYADSSASYAPGSDIRIGALADAFTAAGFKVRKVGYMFDAVFDKDSGASSLAEMTEKLEFVIQAFMSTKDLDLELNRTPDFIQPDSASALKKLAQRFISDGYLIREGGLVLTPQGVFRPELSSYFELGKQLQVEELPSGQRYLDRLSRRLQQAADRSEADYAPASGLRFNPAYQAQAKESPVAALLQNLFPEESTPAVPSEDARQIAALGLLIRPFAEHKILASVGRYQVERLVVPLLYEDLTIDLLKDEQTQTYYGAAAYLGRFHSTLPTFDRARNVQMAGNRLGARDLGELLRLHGLHQTHAGGELLRERTGQTDWGGKSPMDAVLSSGEVVNQLAGSASFDFDGLFQKAVSAASISAVSIGGLSVQPGKSLGFARVKKEGRVPDEFRDSIWIGEYADNTDDSHLFASSGIVMTTGGIQSHGAVRAGENRKPGSIFNTARVTPEGLEFEGYGDYAKASSLQFMGRSLTYEELKEESRTRQIIRDGDLVYLDASAGILYLIAPASDAEGKTVLDFEAFVHWKRDSGYEALRAGKTGKSAAAAIDLGPLENILRGIDNIPLLRAILDELLAANLLMPDDLSRLMSALEDRKDLVGIVKVFLRGRAEQEIAEYEMSLKKLLERLAQKATPSASSVDGLYIEVERFMSQAESLEGLIALSNGSWKGRIRAADIQEGRSRVAQSAMKQLRLYLSMIFYGLREFLQHAAAHPTHELALLIARRSMIARAGAVASIDAVVGAVNASGDYQALDTRIRVLSAQREEEVRQLAGFGILWKDALKDRFSRPLAGGKGSNSAETFHAVDFLKDQGMIPQGFKVETPVGFAIQPAEYERWMKEKGDLHPDLQTALTRGYRDLLIRQMESLLELLDQDERTESVVKDALRDRIMQPALKMLPSVESPAVLTGLVSLYKGYASALVQSSATKEISVSLLNRLQVLGAVAVRSSGLKEDSEEEAMAGMKETRLNVAGAEALFDAVRDVWASGSEAVLVDEMINPKASGTAFSADTATRDLSVVRIEAAHGLAKGLVDQTVKDPDHYLIDKPSPAGGSFELRSEHIGQKQEKVVLDFELGGYAVTDNDPSLRSQPALSVSQRLAVAAMVDGFSVYFGNPVDVEFSIDADNRIVPLQVRPITTLRDAVRRGQDYLRSELRSEPGDEDRFRLIAAPSDWGSRPGYSVKDYAAHIHKGADFYFRKTKAYRFEDLGRFQIGTLTFRLTRFPEGLRADREQSDVSGRGAVVGAASPKYQLEVHLTDESGQGRWRKLEDVEIQDGKPLFIYRSATKHVALPGLFDYFMNSNEQIEVSRLLDEGNLEANSRAVIVVSWKGDDELVRNYYLPSSIRADDPASVGTLTAISRSSADDPDAEARLTVDLDALEKNGSPNSPRGWLAHRMEGFVRPGHLMLMTKVLAGRDYVILQNQGSMNGFRAEEKIPKPVTPTDSDLLSREAQSSDDDSWAAQSLDEIPPEHSLMLQANSYVEGREGKLQFFYNGIFSIMDDSGTILPFSVEEGRLYTHLAGRAPVRAPQNLARIQNGEAQPYEVFYANGRITVTNYSPDENALILVLKGGIRSELRAEGNEAENLPAVPDAANRQLARAEETDRPRGLLARLTEGLQKRVDKVRMNLAVRNLRNNSENVEVEWLQNQTARGVTYTLGLLEKVLDPAEFSKMNQDAKARMAYFLLSNALPEGYEPYVRDRLASLDADSVAGALGYGAGSEEVIPTLLRYNTPESNELVRQLLSHPKASVRQHAYEHLTVGAINHVGSSEEILRETRFLGEGLSVKQILERFSETEDQGFYAFVPRLSIPDLRRFASLSYEVNIFNLGEGRVVLLKGGERIASAMFPGRATRDSNLHNHPSGMIFPTGYQRREYRFGSEEYSGDLMVVGTTGFYHIITKEGITRFYREKGDAKGKPGEMKIRFADKSEMDLKAEVRGGVPELSYMDGSESKYFFTDTALRDSSGRVRDFSASGLLGPSGQVFGLQFISWKSLAGSYLEGSKGDAFGRFIPASMLDPSRMSGEDSEDFENLFTGVVLMNDAVRAKISALRAASEKEEPAAGAVREEEAVSAASLALVPHRAGPVNGLAASVEDALPPLDQIEIRLQVLLARDYMAAVEFADQYLAAGMPAQVKEAVFNGLAHGADYLLPGDVNRYLRLGLTDTDNRVNNSALTLLARAPAGSDVAGALRLAFSRHIQSTRLVRMTGKLNIPAEQKKALFMMYTKTSAVYRNAISESFTKDLYGYAPQTLFFSLVEAALPAEMNEEIILEAYRNLSDFEMQGLEGMTGTHHVPLIPRLNLEDTHLERIGNLVESLGRPRAAQIYFSQIKTPGTVKLSSTGAVLTGTPADSRSSLIQEIERLPREDRSARLTSWAEGWRRGYAALKESEYRQAFAFRQELEDVLSGLSRWDLGAVFNESLLKTILVDLPVQSVRSRPHVARAAGSQLAPIPLSSDAAFEIYQALIRQGMAFFQPSSQRDLPVVIRAVAASSSLNREHKKKIFQTAFSSTEIDENERIGEIIENDIRRPYHQRERSLQYAFDALLEAGFSFAEDVELISVIPMFRGESYSAVLRTMASMGLERESKPLTFIESLRTRHPEIMKMFKEYLADKTRLTLKEEKKSPPVIESRVAAAEDSAGLPELPPGRSELRNVIHAVAEVLMSESPDAEVSRRLAAGLAGAVRELSVDGVAEELRQEAVLAAEALFDQPNGEAPAAAVMDSGLSAFSAGWFFSALDFLKQEKFGAVLDLPGDEIAVSRMLEDNPGLKNRFEMFFLSRSMEPALLKTEGIPVEVIRDPALYRTRFSLTNGSSMPVLTRPDQTARLISNPSAFAAVLTGETDAADDGFEFAALAAMLAGALLTSHFSAEADLLKKNPQERARILEKVWAALLKGGLYEGPSFLTMNDDGVLSIDRTYLQRFMTDFLARKAVEAAA